MHPGGYGGLQQPDEEFWKEPTKGPKSASGVSSANDFTRAEESTDGRLLELEKKFRGDVKIYPRDYGELKIQAYGRSTIIEITSVFKPSLLRQEDIEHLIDVTVNKLRIESDRYEEWMKWCAGQGLKRWY